MADVTNPPNRTCGGCTLCCKLMGIVELNKPINRWCPAVASDHHSCTIYDERPKTCRDFQCVWLADTQGKHLGDDLRPDKIHAVLTLAADDSNTLIVHCDPGYPQAYREGVLARFIAWMQKFRNAGVIAVSGKDSFFRINGEWYRGKQVEVQYKDKPAKQSTVETINIDPNPVDLPIKSIPIKPI